jgi:hypothetical protein
MTSERLPRPRWYDWIVVAIAMTALLVGAPLMASL